MFNIKILYDNKSTSKRFISAWGFSCFIEGLKHNILFDTGGKGDILLHNMKEMGISLEEINYIFLSHIHGDHTGGLISILNKNKNITIWIPDSFPENAKFDIVSYEVKVKSIDTASFLLNNVYSTGQMGRFPKEHAMVIDTEKGLILITGCAHPGIANLAVKTINYINKKIYLILGGFHLRGLTKKDILHTISLLKDIGVEKVAPCHCTGDDAVKLFKEYWKDNFLDTGVGIIIK